MIDLNQLLREQRSKGEPPVVERREHPRYSLDEASGEFFHRGVRFPCVLIDVSMGGCCVRTPRPFMAGALAHVEVVLAVHGMFLRLVGTTQWIDEDRRIGIRFLHPSAKSKNQLAALISCLIDRVAAEAVREATGQRLAPVTTDQEGIAATGPREGGALSAEEIAAADRAVHGEERRVRSYLAGEWPAVLRVAAQRLHLPGALVDVSLNGCCFRAHKPFAGIRDAVVEVEFEIRGLHFRLAGVAAAIYNAHTAGVRFTSLNPRKREELAQLIEELSGGGVSGPHVAAKKSFAEEAPQEQAAFGGEKEEFDDWKISFRD